MNYYLLKGTDILQMTTLYLHATGGDRTRACQGYNIETFNVFTGPGACQYLSKARATSAVGKYHSRDVKEWQISRARSGICPYVLCANPLHSSARARTMDLAQQGINQFGKSDSNP